MGIQSLLAKATAATEFMYDKKATIARYVKIVKPNGADGMDWEPIHTEVPCRLSNLTLNNSDQEEANILDYDVKLFLSSAYEVKAGDKITVNSTVYESAKKPFVYVSHQEVLLKHKGYA